MNRIRCCAVVFVGVVVLSVLFGVVYAAEPELKFSDVIQKIEALKGKKETIESSSYDAVSGSGTAGGVVSLQKQYHQDIDGRIVAGEGKVVKVTTSSKTDRSKVLILTPDSTPQKGYNAILVTKQPEAADLKPGDAVSFRGEIGNLSTWHGASLDITGTFGRIGAAGDTTR